MLDCSVSAASETLSTTSVPTHSNCHAVQFPGAFLFLTFVCMGCVGAHTHAMTHVEVTAQFSGLIFSYHRELKSLGLTTGAFTRPPSCGHTSSIYNAHSYQEALEEKAVNAQRGFHLLAESRTLYYFFSFYQHFLSNILPVKITAVPHNLS